MNQAIIFNDDLLFDEIEGAWRITGQLSGELITIYFHSFQLKQIDEIDQCTKFDLEEIAELWLEKNEPEAVVHITIR